MLTIDTLIGHMKQFLTMQKQGNADTPAVGDIQFGNLRRKTPISTNYGFDRGLPVDRYYIENFLTRYSSDIKGHVLEIGDNHYTCKFGGDRVAISDVLHLKEDCHGATIIGDLCDVPQIPNDIFAIRTLSRILKPGGITLVTLPSITQLAEANWNDSRCWGFTKVSAEKLFEEVFPQVCVKVESFGNVLAAISFLEGLATQELEKEELDFYDPSYPVLITVRAVKPEPSNE
jgi:hypothetical protein